MLQKPCCVIILVIDLLSFDRDACGMAWQGHLMKQSKYFSRWKPRYFRLEDGFLTYYDKKSLVGTHKNKVQ